MVCDSLPRAMAHSHAPLPHSSVHDSLPNGSPAEAHASLAAVLWSDGREAAAEDALNAALEVEPQWKNSDYLHNSTRWPPALHDAMQRLLSISSMPL